MTGPDDLANPGLPEAPPPPDDSSPLVILQRESRFHPRLVPPILALLVATCLLGYRALDPDWHWGKPTPMPPGPIARADDPKKDKPATEAPAQAEGKDPVWDDIRREAEKKRREREEMAKIKEQEAERRAKMPPPRRRRPGAADLARQQRQLEAMMRAQRALPEQMIREMRRSREALLRDQQAQMDQMRQDFLMPFGPGQARQQGRRQVRQGPGFRSETFTFPGGGFMRWEFRSFGP